MSDEKRLTVEDAHRYFAVACNNATWDLLEKDDRTGEQTIEMMHQAHASCWHWSRVGEPVNLVRGHYLVAKAAFAAGLRETGAHWARICWDETERLGLTSWDYAFGCEIIARAAAASGERAEFSRLIAKAQEAIAGLDEQDRSICEGELRREPWFGFPPTTASQRRSGPSCPSPP